MESTPLNLVVVYYIINFIQQHERFDDVIMTDFSQKFNKQSFNNSVAMEMVDVT